MPSRLKRYQQQGDYRAINFSCDYRAINFSCDYRAANFSCYHRLPSLLQLLQTSLTRHGQQKRPTLRRQTVARMERLCPTAI